MKESINKDLPLRHVINSAAGFIFWKNTSGIYIGCNKAFLTTFGFKDISAVKGKTDLELWANKKLATNFRTSDLTVIKTKKSMLIEDVMTINNEKHILITHKSPLKDQAGIIIGTVGMAISIEKQKKIARKLISKTAQLTNSVLKYHSNLNKVQKENIQNKTTFDSLLFNLPGHIYWKDRTGKYLGCNDKQAQSWGLKKRCDVINKKDSDLACNKAIFKKIRKNDLLIMRTGRSTLIEEPIIMHGKKLTVISHKAPLKDISGKVIGVVGVSIDIEKQKEKERKFAIEVKQLSQALNTRRKFLANVSHEIRTPLQGIDAILQEVILQWHSLTEQQCFSLIKKATNNSNRLMSSVSNMLYLSKIGFGNLYLNKQSCDPKILIKSVIKESFNACDTAKIDLEISEKYLSKIDVDLLQIKQVIKDIIRNAFRYENGKNIIVRIHLIIHF